MRTGQGCTDLGRAYIYEYDESGAGWHLDDTIWRNGQDNDNFGYSVSIDEGRILVGISDYTLGLVTDHDTRQDTGAVAFYYEGSNGWSLQSFVHNPQQERFANFGSSVSIDGDYAVVGVPNDDVSGNEDQGSAYLYHWDGSDWIQQDYLTASDGTSSDTFRLFGGYFR